jgi:hypothetical protein
MAYLCEWLIFSLQGGAMGGTDVSGKEDWILFDGDEQVSVKFGQSGSFR